MSDASILALISQPRGVKVGPNLTTAVNVQVGAGTGCFHLTFEETVQRDAFALGLEAQGTRHDTNGDKSIRIFYSNNR